MIAAQLGVKEADQVCDLVRDGIVNQVVPAVVLDHISIEA
jgi:hypothetical protein